jgi:hypothetical protein
MMHQTRSSVMARRLALLIVVVALGSGCATTQSMRPSEPTELPRLNESVQGETVVLTLKDGTEIEGHRARVTADSVRINAFNENERRAVAASRVRFLVVPPDRKGGFRPEVLFGFGGLIGGLGVAASGNEAESLRGGLARFYGGLLLAGAGLITTLALLATPDRERYRVEAP